MHNSVRDAARIALNAYTMDHTASIYLMDAAGEFTGTISYGEQADMRLAKLKKLLAGGVS